MKKSLIILGALALVGCGDGKKEEAPAEEAKSMDTASNEKCYGIARAGMNDCAANGHSCQGQATADGDANEWVYTPEGTCAKLVGGNLEPTA